MSILGKTTSMFYLPPTKMRKDNETDVSAFDKMADTLEPAPNPHKKHKREAKRIAHMQKNVIQSEISLNTARVQSLIL